MAVRKLRLRERNGYRNNNFTEDEYITLINDCKQELLDNINNLENIAIKHLEINQHGDYNSILSSDDLWRGSALLSSIDSFIRTCDYINKY